MSLRMYSGMISLATYNGCTCKHLFIYYYFSSFPYFPPHGGSLILYISFPSRVFYFQFMLVHDIGSFWVPSTFIHWLAPSKWYNLCLTEAWFREVYQNIIDGRETLPPIGELLAELPLPKTEVPPSQGFLEK